MEILTTPQMVLVPGIWKVQWLISHAIQDMIAQVLLQGLVSLQETGMVVPHHVLIVSK